MVLPFCTTIVTNCKEAGLPSRGLLFPPYLILMCERWVGSMGAPRVVFKTKNSTARFMRLSADRMINALIWWIISHSAFRFSAYSCASRWSIKPFVHFWGNLSCAKDNIALCAQSLRNASPPPTVWWRRRWHHNRLEILSERFCGSVLTVLDCPDEPRTQAASSAECVRRRRC